MSLDHHIRFDLCCKSYLDKLKHFTCLCEGATIRWVNRAGLDLLRSPTADNLLGRPISDFISGDFAELFADGLDLIADEPDGIPLKMMTMTGEMLDVTFYAIRLDDETIADGVATPFLVECKNITDLIRAAQTARGRERWLNAILKSVDQAVVSIDEFGLIRSFNEAAEKIFACTSREVIGRNVSLLMPEPHRSRHDDYIMRYHATGEAHILGRTIEVEGQRADGTIFPLELTVTRQSESDGRGVFVGIMRDITVRKAQEERIRFLALHDSLTGLPNRASFSDALDAAVKRAQRHQSRIAVMFVDLDHFKPINDTLGHEAGDAVLRTVAERLSAFVRETDTVARLGGDEFVVILEDVHGREDVAQVADKIVARLPAPIDFEGHPCSVGASIGIALYPEDAATMSELLVAADQAMYAAKKGGRNRYAFA